MFILFFALTQQLRALERALEAPKPQVNSESVQKYSVGPGEILSYKRPGILDPFLSSISDYPSLFTDYFNSEHVDDLFFITALTLILIPLDQELIDESKRIGKKLNINAEDRTEEKFSILGFPIRLPTDTGSAMYFIGDGWTHVGIMFSFFGYGLAKNDFRAQSTAAQLVQGLIATGFTVQVLKHTTGRESPFTTDTPGGVWRFFPNQKEYHHHVAVYDAFPSGHIATTMMTTTVIADNYPEYIWIRPFGYTMMGLLGFQMMNNGVHWAGDYPVGIAIGYACAKIAGKNAIVKTSVPQTAYSPRGTFTLGGTALSEGPALAATFRF